MAHLQKKKEKKSYNYWNFDGIAINRNSFYTKICYTKNTAVFLLLLLSLCIMKKS